jgi:putative transposase
VKQERFSEEKIVGILREAEKSEQPIADRCREHGIAEQTFYRWRRRYGGLETSDAWRSRSSAGYQQKW